MTRVVLNRIGRKVRRRIDRVVARARQLGERLVRPDELEVAGVQLAEAAAKVDLAGKVVVITGSTRGVGLAVARGMAAARARVVVNGRSRDKVEQAVRTLEGAGGEAIGICADISTEDGVRSLLERVVAAFARVDVFINNAAVLGPAGRPAWETTLAEWQGVMAANVTGAFLCMREVTARMLKQENPGRIINVSTGGARHFIPRLAPYLVSKAALEALTRTMALDAGWGGPTVTGIELGSFRTDMTKAFFPSDYYESLPLPETVVPTFLQVATAPRALIHGKILAAWRFEQDSDAEVLLAGPLAVMDRFAFPRPTKAGREVSRFDPDVTALDRAENVQGMPGKVRDVLAHRHVELDFSRYPDEEYPALRRALGAKLGLPESCFTFGNGSSELVERLLRTFLQPGEEVLSNDPSWFMFDRFCETAGVVNRKIGFSRTDGRFDHNLDGFVSAIGVSTRLIYLVNPSNPLGVGIDADRFARFLERVPPHIPVVVDEAYLEYSNRATTLHSHDIIFKTDRRVIGLRTFSKFYGLAGLRIGYAFAAPATLRLFNRLEPLFVLSRLSEAAAVAALADEDHAARTRDNMERERLRICQYLKDRGVDTYPTETNLMLVEYTRSAEKLWQAFEEQGILVPKGLIYDRYVLFPVGRPEQNDRNLEILCSV